MRKIYIISLFCQLLNPLTITALPSKPGIVRPQYLPNAVLIEGVYYALDSDKKTAVVTYGEIKYVGNVTILSKVSYNGILYKVTIISSVTFWRYGDLTSVFISEGIKNIEDKVFYECMNLGTIMIPNSVTDIGNDAFKGCSGLTPITIELNNPKSPQL